jgi:crossover junction endodeoxyribonuclease RuvC
MRILGIDPGSTATGFGLIERLDGNLIHVAHGTLKPPRTAELAERLSFLHRGLSDIIDRYRPEVAVVEQVFVARNPNSAVVLGQARGALLAALGSANLRVCEYTPRAVKQSVVGTGAAAKAQVQAMVTRTCQLAQTPHTDAADALAIAICHATAGRLVDLGVRRGKTRRSLRSIARQLS